MPRLCGATGRPCRAGWGLKRCSGAMAVRHLITDRVALSPGDLRPHVLWEEVRRGGMGCAGLQQAVAGSADSCSRSTELMRRVRRFQLAQYRCLLVKYAKDTRYCTTGVSTHDRWAMGRRICARGPVAGLPGSSSPSAPLQEHYGGPPCLCP